ncbi:MAG: tRNA (adenine(22)-N(1))-methyltransferase [Bacilli bacterium]
MNTTNRMQEIINYSKDSSKVCDIGCDHGLVGISLILEHEIDLVIFSDILSEPLKSAINNTRQYEIDPKKVEFRLGDGLCPIESYEVDTVIITGMGAKTIVEILSRDIKKTKSFKKFVLQPTSGEELLRLWLSDNSFVINKESLIEDNGVFYETFCVSNGKSILTDKEIRFGKHIDYNCNEFISKYSKELENLIKIRKAIPTKYQERIKKFNHEIMIIEEVLMKKDRK